MDSMPTAPSATPTTVDRRGAWKLRLFVYGGLAIVAVLIVVNIGPGSGGLDRLPSLIGSTDQGASVMLRVDGRRVAGLESGESMGAARMAAATRSHGRR